MSDGSPVPEGAEPQPDGSVSIPGRACIAWEDVTLPDGVKLDFVVKPGSEVPTPAANMPDGSQPSKPFGFGWFSRLSKPSLPSLPDVSLPSFSWEVGTKLPQGCQMADGKPVPEGAEPQPDGTVVIPGLPSISWDDVTLPDGVKLSSIVTPGGEAPTPAAKMPDGKKPSKEFGFGWWSTISRPTVSVSGTQAGAKSLPLAGERTRRDSFSHTLMYSILIVHNDFMDHVRKASCGTQHH